MSAAEGQPKVNRDRFQAASRGLDLRRQSGDEHGLRIGILAQLVRVAVYSQIYSYARCKVQAEACEDVG